MTTGPVCFLLCFRLKSGLVNKLLVCAAGGKRDGGIGIAGLHTRRLRVCSVLCACVRACYMGGDTPVYTANHASARSAKKSSACNRRQGWGARWMEVKAEEGGWVGEGSGGGWKLCQL